MSGHYLGEKMPSQRVALIRSVKFEPRPDRTNNHWQQAFEQVRTCFKSGIPAVIDTHRINYTGKCRDEALKQLEALLQGFRKYKPLFLTSAEFGAALSEQRTFTDVFLGEKRALTPIKTVVQEGARKIFKYLSPN